MDHPRVSQKQAQVSSTRSLGSRFPKANTLVESWETSSCAKCFV